MMAKGEGKKNKRENKTVALNANFEKRNTLCEHKENITSKLVKLKQMH